MWAVFCYLADIGTPGCSVVGQRKFETTTFRIYKSKRILWLLSVKNSLILVGWNFIQQLNTRTEKQRIRANFLVKNLVTRQYFFHSFIPIYIIFTNLRLMLMLLVLSVGPRYADGGSLEHSFVYYLLCCVLQCYYGILFLRIVNISARSMIMQTSNNDTQRIITFGSFWMGMLDSFRCELIGCLHRFFIEYCKNSFYKNIEGFWMET